MIARILFIVSEDWYFCSHRLEFAKSAVDAGYEVAVATRVSNHADEIVKAGIKLFRLNHHSRVIRSPFFEARALIELYSIIRLWKPSLIHNVSLKNSIYGSFLSLFFKGTRVVNAISGLGYAFTNKSVKARVLKFLISNLLVLLSYKKCFFFIVQNVDDRKVLQSSGIAETQLFLIEGAGVNVDIYKPSTHQLSGCPIVMLASRLLWAKGVGDFVASAKILRTKIANVRFVLIGEIDDKNPDFVPEIYLREWCSLGYIEWWGRQNEMHNILTQAAVVCLPSVYGEGVPKVLIEAASCGLPLVTYDMPGCREIVVSGENGFVVPAGDVQQLSHYIKVLIEDDNLAATMGARSREIVEKRFSNYIIYKKIFTLYNHILK